MKTNLVSALIMLMGMIQGYGVTVSITADNTNAPVGLPYAAQVVSINGGTAAVYDKFWLITTIHLNIVSNTTFIYNGVANVVTNVVADTNSQILLCQVKKPLGNSSTWIPPYVKQGSLDGMQFVTAGYGAGRGTEMITTEIVNTSFHYITNLYVTDSNALFEVFGGDSGTSFAVEISTNLQSWVTLTNTFTFSGPESFTSVSISKPDCDQAFFRIRSLTTTITNGWIVPSSDGKKRWAFGKFTRTEGENIISSFTLDGCLITPGDSGGPVFVKDTDGKWKLAAINYGSFYTPWSQDGGFNTFPAALVDQTGLWWYYFPFAYYYAPCGRPQPSESFHTAVAPRSAWIKSVVGH